MSLDFEEKKQLQVNIQGAKHGPSVKPISSLLAHLLPEASILQVNPVSPWLDSKQHTPHSGSVIVC